MFNPRYFSPRYWARRFWPGGQATEAAVAAPRRRQRPDQRVAVIVAVAPGPTVDAVGIVTPRALPLGLPVVAQIGRAHV